MAAKPIAGEEMILQIRTTSSAFRILCILLVSWWFLIQRRNWSVVDSIFVNYRLPTLLRCYARLIRPSDQQAADQYKRKIPHPVPPEKTDWVAGSRPMRSARKEFRLETIHET